MVLEIRTMAILKREVVTLFQRNTSWILGYSYFYVADLHALFACFVFTLWQFIQLRACDLYPSLYLSMHTLKILFKSYPINDSYGKCCVSL